MPDYAVNVGFSARDRVTPAFKKMGKQAKLTGSIFKGVLSANLVTSGFQRITQGLVAVTGEFISYDQAITAASAKFKGLNLTTQEGQATLQKLKDTARLVGATTQFSATEAAGGLDFLAMAGFNAEQSMAALPGVANLATVAQTDLARATDIASDSLGAFGLMTQDAAQLQVNFTRINDVFAKTMTTANTNMEDLFESVKKGGPAFTAAGQSLESFAAMAGVMANSGVKGSESGTALRNVMLRLSAPTGKAAQILKDLNIKTKDSEGNFRDVIDILADFEKGLKGMGTAQKTAALSTVFGARTVTGVNILLQEGSDRLREYRSSLEGAGGASLQMSETIRQSLLNRLKGLQSAAIELGFKFLEVFEKQGAGAIDKITQAIREFDPSPIISRLKVTLTIFQGLFKVIKVLWPFLPAIAAGYAAIIVQQKLMVAYDIAKMFISMITPMWGVITAQGVMNTVMAMNPLMWIPMAIAAVVLLWQNWDTVKVKMLAAWNWFSKMLDNPFFKYAALILMPFITIPALIIKKWEPIKEFFAGLGRGMKAIGGFFGIGSEAGEAGAGTVAPNTATTESRAIARVEGDINVRAAAGTDVDVINRSKDVNIQKAGAN